MAVLPAIDAQGGAVGDTFEDYVITRIIRDGLYLWDRVTSAAQTQGPASDEQVLGTLPAGVWTDVPSNLSDPMEVAVIWNADRSQDYTFGIATRKAGNVMQAHSNTTLNNLIFLTQGVA